MKSSARKKANSPGKKGAGKTEEGDETQDQNDVDFDGEKSARVGQTDRHNRSSAAGSKAGAKGKKAVPAKEKAPKEVCCVCTECTV